MRYLIFEYLIEILDYLSETFIIGISDWNIGIYKWKYLIFEYLIGILANWSSNEEVALVELPPLGILRKLMTAISRADHKVPKMGGGGGIKLRK